jgi:hypothetical protein
VLVTTNDCGARFRWIRRSPLFAIAMVLACAEMKPKALGASGASHETNAPDVSGDAAAPSPGSAALTTVPAPRESPDVPALTAAELARPWARLAVPQAREASSIVRAPEGFVALAREVTPTGGKALGPVYNYLYRSDDGIRWRRLPLPAKELYYGKTQVVYGAGRYLVVESGGGGNVLWTSTDLAQWSKATFAEERDGGDVAPFDAATLVRVHGLFMGFGVNDLFVSSDGVAWKRIYIPLVQGRAVAFGNGMFVLAGALAVRTSRDGSTWEDPASLPGSFGNVAFLEDRFYVEEFTSTDAITWRAHGDTIANGEIGGYLFNDWGEWTPNGIEDRGLRVWRPGAPVRTITIEPAVSSTPLAGGVGADEIVTPLAGGETCLTHRCVIVHQALYLIR